MDWVVEQFAHDPLTDFADPAGDENLHYADAPITSRNSAEAQRSLRKGFMKITLRALYHYNANFALIWNARTQRLTPAKAQSTPSFAALASLRDIFRVSVAALPRCVSAVKP